LRLEAAAALNFFVDAQRLLPRTGLGRWRGCRACFGPVAEIASWHAPRTVFTRFEPPATPDAAEEGMALRGLCGCARAMRRYHAGRDRG
jgi:hypothetical protein